MRASVPSKRAPGYYARRADSRWCLPQAARQSRPALEDRARGRAFQRPLTLEGSDPAVGPGPVGVRPWITAVRPPVGDQDQPGIDQLAPVEQAQDRVLAAGDEHGAAALGHLGVRAHLLRRALVGGM